jgi:hypothetical protein
MVSIKMKLMPLLKIGSETCQQTKRAYGHSKQPRPKNFSKTQMKAKYKKTN